MTDTQIHSAKIQRGENLKIGKNSFIKADEVILGDDISIGDNVEIICEKLALGNGCKIGDNTILLCNDIELAEGSTIGNAVQAELNEYLRLGAHSVISNRVTIAGQGVSAGAFLWLKNDVIIGGGGSQGPNSYLKMGAHVAIMDKAFINLSEEVTIGDSSALSCNVIVLTHGASQPLLMGYGAKFAPVTIGSNCALYINSVILPGVNIGDYSTIAAASLVNKDIPAYALASGNPARVIVKGKGSYPRALEYVEIDEVMETVLTDYAATLKPKGLKIVSTIPGNNLVLTVVFEERTWTIIYFGNTPAKLPAEALPDISLSYREIPQSKQGNVHFDLKELRVTGDANLLSEDLRDYLRRRSIKVHSGQPFRTIPLSNLNKLKEKRKSMHKK